MPIPSAIRMRRSAAQLLAVAGVARAIRADDSCGRRKYIRDFSQAFQSYQGVLGEAQMDGLLRSAGIVLVGDYHALPASQRYAARLIERLAAMGRPAAVGLEMVFSRDQHILEEWLRGEIDEQELRERIRYDLDWGYDWQPVRELLQSARRHGQAVYGLDCVPRDDLRRILARDRHAAAKIGEMRERHPGSALVVVFGESHLAPSHLPGLLRQRLPGERMLTVLQNVDPLYWRAFGERRQRVEAVRVRDDVVCVFNSTPLEKYESYRMCLERWRQVRAAAPDPAPTIDNLIDALLRFLNVDKYSARNGTQPRFLVDLMPEVHSRPSGELLEGMLQRKLAPEAERRRVLARVAEQGSCYVPSLNAIFVRQFQMAPAAEEAARFVHRACRGLLKRGLEGEERAPEDRFYGCVLEDALAYFGSRVLCPEREPVREAGLYALYAQPREAIEERTLYSYRDYMQMIDFIILHKDYEANPRQYWLAPPLLQEGVSYNGERFAFATRQLGYMLGSQLYDAYIAGRVTRRWLRGLYFRDLGAPGAARIAYFQAAGRIRDPRQRRLAA